MESKFLRELEVIYEAGSRIARALRLMNKADASDELRREIIAHEQLTKAHVAKVRKYLDTINQDGLPIDASLASSNAWIEALIHEGNLDVKPACWTRECEVAANLLEIILSEENQDCEIGTCDVDRLGLMRLSERYRLF